MNAFHLMALLLSVCEQLEGDGEIVLEKWDRNQGDAVTEGLKALLKKIQSPDADQSLEVVPEGEEGDEDSDVAANS